MYYIYWHKNIVLCQKIWERKYIRKYQSIIERLRIRDKDRDRDRNEELIRSILYNFIIFNTYIYIYEYYILNICKNKKK